jgi:Glycosyl hydrolases family 43
VTQIEGRSPSASTTVVPLTSVGSDLPADATRRVRGTRNTPTRIRWVAATVTLIVIVGGALAGVAIKGDSAPPPPAAPANAPAGLVVRGQSVPSPYVLIDGSHRYLYTGGYGSSDPMHVPVREFTDLSHLGPPVDAMPEVPAGSWDWIWTVDIDRTPSGYVMWFTTEYLGQLNPAGVPNQCIGQATSTSPTGPFTPTNIPVICQPWGSIDPRVTTDVDGTRYLVWKADTNADHSRFRPTTIWSQRLAADGTTLVDAPVQIAQSTQPWEAGLAESPDLVKLGGTFYLFFSGNSSGAPVNGIGMMTCYSIQGPCYDNRTTPFLDSNSQGQGPGEESLFQQNGVTWLLYSPNAIFGPYLYRPLAVARVAVGPHGPYLAQFAGATPGT